MLMQPLYIRIRYIGKLFAARNVTVAPTTPDVYPHLYEPAPIAEICLGALGRDHDPAASLDRVATAGEASFYIVPEAATDALAELTPARRELTQARVAEISQSS